MKKYIKYVIGCMFLLSILIIPTSMTKVSAASATKVKCKKNYKNGYEWVTVKGYTKKGKLKWSYKTPKYCTTQLEQTTYNKRGNRIYVYQNKTIKVLKLSNGKLLWKIKTDVRAAHIRKFDSKNNLFLAGFSSDYVYKISSRGKKLWRTNMKYTKNYWPGKMTYKKGVLTILYDENEDSVQFDGGKQATHFIKFEGATGKILNYK